MQVFYEKVFWCWMKGCLRGAGDSQFGGGECSSGKGNVNITSILYAFVSTCHKCLFIMKNREFKSLQFLSFEKNMV